MTELSQLNLDFQGSEATTLFFEPLFRDKDILGMFRTIPNVTTKRKIAFVQELEKIVRTYSGCGFTPAGSARIYDRWIETDKAKADVAICWEEFQNTVWEEALKRGVDIADMNGTVIADILLTLVSHAVKKDIQRLAFFGNKASTNPAYDITDGLWTVHIPAFVAASQTPYYNAGSGTALAAGDGIDLLRAVHANQENQLAALPNNMKKFLVDRSVWEAYRNDIEDGGGGDSGIRLLQDGTEVLTFRGIEVVQMLLWNEIMATDFSSADAHQVLLTSPENLALATDLSGQDPRFKVWYDDEDEELKAKTRFRLGFQVIHPSLMSVAY